MQKKIYWMVLESWLFSRFMSLPSALLKCVSDTEINCRFSTLLLMINTMTTNEQAKIVIIEANRVCLKNAVFPSNILSSTCVNWKKQLCQITDIKLNPKYLSKYRYIMQQSSKRAQDNGACIKRCSGTKWVSSYPIARNNSEMTIYTRTIHDKKSLFSGSACP
jgi:hypothetical protein